MKILGIDIGYGHVKVAWKDSRKQLRIVKFPTAVVLAQNTNYGEDENIMHFEKEKYLVAEDAIINTLDSRSPEFLIKYAPLFIAYAIKLTGIRPSNFDTIATGISVKNWKNFKSELQERITKFSVNGVAYRFKNVTVTQQGRGILFDQNQQQNKGYTVVVDGGYLTLDLIAFKDGKIVPDAVFATLNGANKMLETLQIKVNDLTQNDYTLVEINDILKDGYVVSHGTKKDLTETIRQVKMEYVIKLLNIIKTQMSTYLGRADKVLISGGVAHFLKGVKFNPNTILTADPEFGNARGYLKMLGGA